MDNKPVNSQTLTQELSSDVTNIETAKLLLKEWKIRQQHCWSILPRYGLAAVSVSITPYIQMELLKKSGIWLLWFPFFGWLLAAAATWLFIAEHYRSYSVLARYRLIIGHSTICTTSTPWEEFLIRYKVRWITPGIFFIGFTIITIINIYVLWNMH